MWQPTANWETLKLRASMLAQIRQFFLERGVIEVDVPVMAKACGTDSNIESWQTLSHTAQGYLLSSPEFYLKRVLAAFNAPIYSLGKAFRAEEVGHRHSPEFTMLEWYRPSWTIEQLQQEVADLVGLFIAGEARCVSYRQLFVEHFNIDPHCARLAELKQLAQQHCHAAFDSDEKSVWLDLLFSHIIEPELVGKVFVNQFPAAQAALSEIELDDYGNPVASRFELYVDGVELANAYVEELNAAKLRARFESDLQLRRERGQPEYPIDELFLSAMAAGMPAAVGVALGVDRLLMVAARLPNLASALPFADFLAD